VDGAGPVLGHLVAGDEAAGFEREPAQGVGNECIVVHRVEDEHTQRVSSPRGGTVGPAAMLNLNWLVTAEHRETGTIE